MEHRVIKEILLKDQKLNSKAAFIIGVLIAHMGLLFWQYERMKDRATKQIKINKKQNCMLLFSTRNSGKKHPDNK